MIIGLVVIKALQAGIMIHTDYLTTLYVEL